MYINQHLSINLGVKIMHVTGRDLIHTEDYQFIYLQKGTVVVQQEPLDSSREKDPLPPKIMLQKDDILLIPPHHPFTCSHYTPNTLLGIRLDTPFISSLIPPGYILECNSTQGPKKNYTQLLPILTRICSTYYMEDNHFLMISLIYELIDCLKKNFIHRHTKEALSDVELRNQERIATITQYLQDFYHQPISLDMLADKMFLTPQYLSKFIKKQLGTTFSRHLASIRLDHARTELLETDHSITNIALGNGFPNITAFNKAFREKYEQAPSIYRTQFMEKQTKKETSFLPCFEIHSEDSIRAIQTEIDTVMPYEKPWLDTINIGSLPEALNISFHNSILDYKDAIPVKYIRFYDIFSEEIIFLDPKTNEFNFTNLDEILHFFYRLHIIPFIELGNKPSRTHIMGKTLAREGKNEKDFSYYTKALTALLHHYINQFGVHYMSQWRFELWLPHGHKAIYPSFFHEYFEQYHRFYSIVKELLPDCAFGGPGFNMCSDIHVFSSFLQQAKLHQLSFDFISLYAFGYETQKFEFTETNDNHGILATNPDHIIDIFLKYKTMLQHTEYGTLPIFITELACSLSLENHIEDSVFQAAFLCKTMLQLSFYCENIAYLGFWDNCLELPDASQVYYSSSSLVDYNGIPKPALHGYSFLSKLGKNLVSQGEHYIMTCNSSNRYQLLFYHYVHYNDSFCFSPWDRIPLENTYEVFEQKDPLPIHFTCENFPPGRYKVVRFSLNRNYGSALDKYLRILDIGTTSSDELLGTLLNLREEETRYYKQTSIPRQDIYYTSWEDILTFDLTLDPHEVVFYEISRVF